MTRYCNSRCITDRLAPHQRSLAAAICTSAAPRVAERDAGRAVDKHQLVGLAVASLKIIKGMRSVHRRRDLKNLNVHLPPAAVIARRDQQRAGGRGDGRLELPPLPGRPRALSARR